MGQVRRFWQAALAASFMLPVQQAAAADVWAVGGPGEEQGLRLRGPILSGDDKHFATAIEQIEATSSRVTAVALESPGGVLGAAAAIAGQIHAHGITTVVENGAICVSACVLLFAAGQTRVAGPTAMIGVHGAADEHGTQTAPALVATAAIARRYAEYRRAALCYQADGNDAAWRHRVADSGRGGGVPEHAHFRNTWG